MAANVTLTKDNKDFDLTFVVKDKDDVVYDLTGHTVAFHLSDGEFNNKISGACVITDAVNGACKYTVVDGDLDLPPEMYLGELELTIGGKVISNPTKFTVRIVGKCG